MMQRSDWSRIAHGDLEFMGPYDESSFERLLDGAALPAGARVLDLGCGNGALLRWLASRAPIDGTGVDLHPGTRPILGVRLVAGDARSFPAEPESFDMVCSVGAVSGIGRLGKLARPGGLVLLGDGYWRQAPGDAYLDALGATVDDMLDWQATLAIGAPHGLTLMRALPSSVEQWDAYEATWAANGERYAAEHPAEPGLAEFLEWIRNGRRR
ncbi:MAG TPA: class I SAM-dependent methyltransferase, partial [Gaiellales bacterium]|nr:class I SAM-dependent methyltransferase [Gaiellales bacterium]